MSTNSGPTADQILKAIMLSATFTSMEPVVFDHVNGTTGTWTHDDYDAAHAQLHALLAEVEKWKDCFEAVSAACDATAEDWNASRAEVEQLRTALKAIREVASVAHNGDSWYCENEGVDAAAAFKLASEALGEAVRG